MIHIKNNPCLVLNAIEDKIKTPFDTIIVSPFLEMVARELSHHFIYNVFKFEKDGKELTIEEAIKMNLFEFKVLIEERLEDNEWMLITENEIYYSAGDNTNN